MDKRVQETYTKASKGDQLDRTFGSLCEGNPLGIGPYRRRRHVVAFVTNNSFLDAVAFDGMRKNLATDFDAIYVLDLGGNVRKNPKLSGTTHNVFGIQVGVSINLLVKKNSKSDSRSEMFYARVDEFWRKEEKVPILR